MLGLDLHGVGVVLFPQIIVRFMIVLAALAFGNLVLGIGKAVADPKEKFQWAKTLDFFRSYVGIYVLWLVFVEVLNVTAWAARGDDEVWAAVGEAVTGISYIGVSGGLALKWMADFAYKGTVLGFSVYGLTAQAVERLKPERKRRTRTRPPETPEVVTTSEHARQMAERR